MAYTIVTGPASEPLTLTEVKLHLRVDHSSDDNLITMLIQAAREYVEQTTGRALLSQTIREYWDDFPTCCTLDLALSPLTSVTNFQYIDEDGATQTISGSNYTADTVSKPARIVKRDDYTWPTVDDIPNAVWVTYVAGAANAGALDASLKQAMLLQIGYWYENREDMPVNETNNPRIRSAGWILDKYKTAWI